MKLSDYFIGSNFAKLMTVLIVPVVAFYVYVMFELDSVKEKVEVQDKIESAYADLTGKAPSDVDLASETLAAFETTINANRAMIGDVDFSQSDFSTLQKENASNLAIFTKLIEGVSQGNNAREKLTFLSESCTTDNSTLNCGESIALLEDRISELQTMKRELEERVVLLMQSNAVEYLERQNAYAIYFGFNNSDLTPVIETALKNVVDENYTERSQVSLIGYTDSRGSEKANCNVAKRRIQSIRNSIRIHNPHITIIEYPVGELSLSKDGGTNNSNERRVELIFDENLTNSRLPLSVCSTDLPSIL